MSIQMRRNQDETITLQHDTQTFNGESMDIEVHGEITLPAEEWLRILPQLEQMARGGGVVGVGMA